MPNRRQIIVGASSAAAGLLCIQELAAQVLPIALRLVRRIGWEELMARNQCVIGDLYHTTPAFPLADLGAKICNTLELAYRNNINEISAIPPGGYEGFVRTDGPRGWRIELKGTQDRSNIQVHVGNRPSDTIGCILPGTGESTDASCKISGSAAAMRRLKEIVGESQLARVALLIQS